MSLRISVDIFSGRPNPVVELRGREATDALKRLRPGRSLSTREARLPSPMLGYRGLIVEQIEQRAPQLPKVFRVADGIIFGPDWAREASDPGFEDFICGSRGPIGKLGLNPGFFSFWLREFERFREMRQKLSWPLSIDWPTGISCSCAPLYEPDWWNDGGTRLANNNCYNYACDYRTDTYATPGLAAGVDFVFPTCALVQPAAVADALIDSPGADNQCPEEGHLVALVVVGGEPWDFHLYRKERNGCWSHKPGPNPVTNFDNSGAIIDDPRTADRGIYTVFCTFMVVMHGHIKIK
jgi:hypothetical protein